MVRLVDLLSFLSCFSCVWAFILAVMNVPKVTDLDYIQFLIAAQGRLHLYGSRPLCGHGFARCVHAPPHETAARYGGVVARS